MIKNKEPRFKVQIRGGFADRNKIHPVNTDIQFEEFDDRSRVTIINQINALYHLILNTGNYEVTERKNAFWRSVLHNVYSQQIDYSRDISYREDDFLEIINESIYMDDYANVLSVVEFIAQLLNNESSRSFCHINVFQRLNKAFEKEFIGYRFVNGQIARITNDIEISEIEEAASIKRNKVDEHISKALKLLSDRERPDYENSIKESISAVEAMCNEITGNNNTLGEALKLLKRNASIHPCLESAFEKLYGYTCDASGVRHA